MPLEIPPLRDRREDIPLLVEHFCRKLAARSGRVVPQLTHRALQALYDYAYPGNVRELRNILERAFVVCPDSTIDLSHLPREVVGYSADGKPTATADRERNDPSASEQPARQLPDRSHASAGAQKLLAVLDSHGWNRSSTAAALGISRTTLWRRMKELHLLHDA